MKSKCPKNGKGLRKCYECCKFTNHKAAAITGCIQIIKDHLNDLTVAKINIQTDRASHEQENQTFETTETQNEVVIADSEKHPRQQQP